MDSTVPIEAISPRRFLFFFFSSRRRHTRYWRDWSSDMCSSDLLQRAGDDDFYSSIKSRECAADVAALLDTDLIKSTLLVFFGIVHALAGVGVTEKIDNHVPLPFSFQQGGPSNPLWRCRRHGLEQLLPFCDCDQEFLGVKCSRAA